MIKRTFRYLTLIIALGFGAQTHAAENYAIDIKGMHAFIQFKINHLGYSWLIGRFNKFDGSFTYDAKNPKNNKAEVKIAITSIDSNHAERDKHLRSPDFFDAAKYPTATFKSTKYISKGKNSGVLKGKLTLRGVTKDISIKVKHIAGGKDPWGGFRRGFEGTTTLKLSDYKMAKAAILGPAANSVELKLYLEGIRK